MINLSFILLLLPLLHFSPVILCSNTSNQKSLDAILHHHAVEITSHHKHRHTDELYAAPLPPSLAGVNLSILTLRSRTLWRKGANFSGFFIPPGTLPTPYAKRLLILYINFGNRSSLYYTLSGYTLLAPVVGFLVYDASSKNASKIKLNTNGKPISIHFHGPFTDQKKKCVVFGGNKEVFFSEMRLDNMCYTTNQGHFSIAIQNKKKKMGVCWIIVGLVGGFGGVIILLGIMGVRLLMCNKNQEMEKVENEEECLEACWIDSSKMPRAEVMRTQPVLEGTSLPNPKMSWYA